jgi:hypothetical protein
LFVFQYNPYLTTWYRGDVRPSPVGAPHSLHVLSRSAPQQEQLSTTNIYIRALRSDTKDEDLEEMCKEFGEISSVKAIIDKTTGECKGMTWCCALLLALYMHVYPDRIWVR